jgi:light-regulated signal transduction histidine kinase (bacteriophytochrome)
LERRLKPQLSSEAIDFMTQIKNNAHQMHRLIEGILYYSTLDHQEKKQAALEEVNLKDLLEEIKKILSTTIREKKAFIHYSDDLPVINSSPEALQVVLKNLVENGIKYNRSRRPEVTISYKAHFDEHHILVQDNGIGIEPQYQHLIFQMFKRLHNQEEFKGTGMGLAICRKLLRRFGGDIALESKPENGTLFTVILPIKAKQYTADSVQGNSLN